ncbi:MAG: hypothetical protein HRU14_18170, partial [Planctomycetes bacterium]|nr:hypothetical protein [Planctomycetota bacterium]
LHSPFFMKWPAVLPAGGTVDTPVSHIDVFSTAAAAAGAPLPGDRVIDGVDLIPYATGRAEGDAHDALFWRSGDLQVVMADGWKLQVDGRQDKRWLYQLDTDPTEQRNLAEAEPERVRELQDRLDAFNREVGPRHFPVLIENAVPIDRTRAEGDHLPLTEDPTEFASHAAATVAGADPRERDDVPGDAEEDAPRPARDGDARLGDDAKRSL